MAKLTAPLMSAEARGKVSGLVFNTWRGAATTKAKTAPAQPRTAKQMAIRAICILVARAWQSLEAAERAQWDAYATAHPEIDWTGNPKRLTGANWYQRLNVRGLKFQGATYDVPPADPAPNPVTDLAVADASDKITVTWTTTGAAGDWVVIWASGPHSAGQTPRFPKARFQALVAVGTQTYDIDPAYEGRYDVWVATWNATTGLESVLQVASVDVA